MAIAHHVFVMISVALQHALILSRHCCYPIYFFMTFGRTTSTNLILWVRNCVPLSLMSRFLLRTSHLMYIIMHSMLLSCLPRNFNLRSFSRFDHLHCIEMHAIEIRNTFQVSHGWHGNDAYHVNAHASDSRSATH